MLIRTRSLFLIALCPATAFCQVPPESLPAQPPKYTEVSNMDGNPARTSNDFQAFLNAYNAADAYDQMVSVSRPFNVTGLAAAVSGQTVTLNWTLPAANLGPAPTDLYVVTTAGATRIAPTLTTYAFSPGPGTWTITVASRRAFAGFVYAPVLPAPSVSATVVGTQPPPGQGPVWTDLTPPAGATVAYVAASGNDANPGTQTAPLRSFGAGYAKVRDGFADQVLLKCGDTFAFAGQINVTKGCTTAGRYTVIGSYGTGPRPKFTFTGCTGFRGEQLGKRGVAFVGLDIVGNNTVDTSGIIMLSWDDVLIEDCKVSAFRDNIVIQDAASTGAVKVKGFKMRYSLSVDAKFNGAAANARSQGIYMGGLENWLIEGCVFDRDGIEGSMFSHNIYAHESCTSGTFRDNITARSPSEGIQQRPGGSMVNNLSLANSYDLYFGGPGNVDYNVCLDSKDINATDTRGTGFLIDGATSGRGNVAALNRGGTGWGSVRAFQFRGVTGTFTDCLAYDWPDAGHSESQGFMVSGGSVRFVNCRAIQPVKGWGWETEQGGTITGTGNTYWLNGSFPRDQSEQIAVRLSGPSPSYAIGIPDYMAAIGRSPATLDGFMTLVRNQSRQTFDPALYGPTVTKWVRARVGIAEPPAN